MAFSNTATKTCQRPIVCAFLYPRSCLLSNVSVQPVKILGASIGSNDGRRSDFNCRQFPSYASRRFFSSTASRGGMADAIARSRAMQKRSTTEMMSKEPSMSVGKRRALQTSLAENGSVLDIGLLPSTLVPPTASSTLLGLPGIPSVIGLDRWRYEWARVKLRAKEFVSMILYKWYYGGRGKSRPKLDNAGVPEIATRLHYDMWTAFAQGDVDTIRYMCAQGLAENLIARISKRGSGQRVEWTLDHYVGRPRVMSNKAAQMVEADGLAVRQIIVRIRSVQRMTTTSAKKSAQQKQQQTPVKDDGGKECDELFVIQRTLINKVENRWVVWGTTQETDITPLLRGEELP